MLGRSPIAANIPYSKLGLTDGDIPPAKLASIPYAKLSVADGDIPCTKLGAFPGSKITASTVTSLELTNNAVGTTEITDGAVTLVKLSAIFRSPLANYGTPKLRAPNWLHERPNWASIRA